jgi:hypothetical protein
VLLEQADMIQRASDRSVPEAADRDNVRRRHKEVLAVADHKARREAAARELATGVAASDRLRGAGHFRPEAAAANRQ